MLIRVGIVIDQRGVVSELTGDIRVLAGKGAPGLQLLLIDVPRVSGLEFDGCVSCNYGTEGPSVLRECGSCERDRQRNGDNQS
jgi:hypothetical protein